MIKVERVETWGFEHAVRGMRNPMNSWDRSDSMFGKTYWCIGPDDLELMQKLYKAGTEHRKYLRQIFVSMDITAPLYWWKEFDTYKVGTVANSCSTMHKIHEKEFSLSDFSCEHCTMAIKEVIETLNAMRYCFLKTNSKVDWYAMIQLLPESYNQKRTVTMTYENAVSIIHQRTGHKLDEWNEFCRILRKLPYIAEIEGSATDGNNN